jgi:pyrroline-5-carboxylate reductase
MQNQNYTLGIVGYGNMARAIVQGLRAKGGCPALVVSDVCGLPENGDGIRFTADNAALAASADVILLAVKPNMLGTVAGQLGGGVRGKAVVSILAGTSIAALSAALPAAACHIRVMPNLCARALSAASAICFSPSADAAARGRATAIFSAVGGVWEVAEDKLHAVTALSGSGPAYVFMFLDAMTQAGVRLGLTPAQARALATATVEGAAKTAGMSPDLPLSDMTAAVCSKGGTTVEAVGVFEAKGLLPLVDEAMTACYNKSRRLAGESV